MIAVHKKMDCEFLFTRVETQNILSIQIRRSALLEWIAILWMMLEDLGCVSIEGSNGVRCLIQSSGAGTQVDKSASGLKVRLSKDDLIVLAAYLLRYYRDGFADVDHIDFDVAFTNERGYLTFKVEEFAPSLSGEEARRKLGM